MTIRFRKKSSAERQGFTSWSMLPPSPLLMSCGSDWNSWSQVQATEVIFLHSVWGFSLRDRVRSNVIQEGLEQQLETKTHKPPTRHLLVSLQFSMEGKNAECPAMFSFHLLTVLRSTTVATVVVDQTECSQWQSFMGKITAVVFEMWQICLEANQANEQ